QRAQWQQESETFAVRISDLTEKVAAIGSSERALQEKYEEEHQLQHYLIRLHQLNIELTLIENLDQFFQQIVKLGLEYLGFDRIGVWLYDTEQNMVIGTYGTDLRGNMQSEAGFRFALQPGGGMWKSLQRPDRFIYEESAPLKHNLDEVGTGWKVTIALWHGNRNLGWLSVDNLIHQKPISQPQLEILAQYGLLVAALLARKQAERRQQESEQMLQAVMDNIPIRVFWKDSNFRLLGCNRQFVEDSGFPSADDLIGKSDEDFARDQVDLPFRNELPKYREDDQRVVETGVSIYGREERQTRKAGQVHWLRTSKVPLRNVEGNIIGILGSYEDITER
ncbi:MAG: PAS domain-containing protein, partial [Candidatus Methanoperedens sp.]|nr:PAS domain-containing protein [Candidatus Methanoperedens sp.]